MRYIITMVKKSNAGTLLLVLLFVMGAYFLFTTYSSDLHEGLRGRRRGWGRHRRRGMRGWGRGWTGYPWYTGYPSYYQNPWWWSWWPYRYWGPQYAY